MENPTKMDDLGVPLFSETSIYDSMVIQDADADISEVTFLKIPDPPWKINMEPENTGPLEDEHHLPNHDVEVLS